jgi:hypothetical protein
MYSMASLILHHDGIPAAAREALRAAQESPGERRLELLGLAAHVLHTEAGIACPDALELVDLQTSTPC